MRKFIKGGSFFLATLMAFGFAGCNGMKLGGKVVNNVDDDPNDSRIPIFINVDMGGTGSAWIEEMAKDWNATQTEYRIVVDCDRKIDVSYVQQQTLSPNGKYSAFFLPYMLMQSLAQNGKIEDLTDICNATVEGESRTIWDKVKDKDLWDKLGSKYDGTGQYILPYATAIMGLVFDYDFFLDRGYLNYAAATELSAVNANGTVAVADGAKLKCSVAFGNYEVGDYILTTGKDGKYGTYDDGQPTTVEEFNELLSFIAERDRTILYSGKQPTYIQAVSQAIFGQYAGTDAYETFYTFDSKGKNVKLYDTNSGQVTEKTITIDNGYEVFGMEALYKATSYTKDWFLNRNQIHLYSEKGEEPMVIQKDYLNGFRELDGNPYAGFLVEGSWWENEARGYFNELGARYSDRGYGKREYRYMLLPAMPGQATESNKSKFFSQDSGSFVVAKHASDAKSQEKLAKLKEFLITTLSDANLRRFTRMTGIVRSYDYELTNEDKAEMTPFARNVWDIYHDPDHVEILQGFLLRAGEPIYKASANGQSISGYAFPAYVDKIATSTIVTPMRDGATVAEVFNSMKTRYSASMWASLVAKARSDGWYPTQD